MSPFRPKSKFDHYFSAIGEFSYLVILCAGVLFLIGVCCYQLFVGNYKWFKENPEIFLLLIIVTGICIGLFKSRKI